MGLSSRREYVGESGIVGCHTPFWDDQSLAATRQRPLPASFPHCAITGVTNGAAATTAYRREAVERGIGRLN